MFTQQNIRDFVFGEYSKLIEYVGRKEIVRRHKILPEEIVNEAVISIFDCKLKFNDANDISLFMKKAIESIINSERHSISDLNFYTHKSIDGHDDIFFIHEKIKATPTVIMPSPEFINVYAIFEEHKFYKTFGKIQCHRCGCFNVVQIKFGKHQGSYHCTICNTTITITSGTYINRTTTSYQKLFLMIKTVSENTLIYTRDLMKIARVSIKTAHKYRALVLSTINEIGNNQLDNIIKKILTVKTDEQKEMIINMKPKRLAPDEINEIRRLYSLGKYSCEDIAPLFNRDRSSIARIVRKDTYIF